MKFGPIPVEDAEGKLLGHNVAGADGRRALRKGKALTANDVALLRSLGRETVYVAKPEVGDVDENAAAERIAQALMGSGLRLSGPSTGRVNLYTETLGIVRVDAARLLDINRCRGVTVATLHNDTVAREGTVAATIKVPPFALPEKTVTQVEQVAANGGPLVRVDALRSQKVALVLSGSPSARVRIVRSFETALRDRLEALNSTISSVDFVPMEDEGGESLLAALIAERVEEGADMIILAGETAIMDRYDIAPRAVEAAGGEVVRFGAPVDPGNLLMIAYRGAVPIVGAPGCARSPKDNIVDLILPRLLAGDRLSEEDIIAFGHGGLLEDVPERPSPRSRLQ